MSFYIESNPDKIRNTMIGTNDQVMSLPKPKDFSYHLSKVTRNQEASQIKAFYKYFFIPGIGQLAGGLPYFRNFPFDTLEASTATPQRFHPSPSKSSQSDPNAGARVIVPEESTETDLTKKIDIKTALQYGQASGYPAMMSWVKAFTTQCLHPNILYDGGVDVVMTSGSTDGFSRAIQAFFDEWVSEDDAVSDRQGLLVEEFAYMNALQQASTKGANIVAVAMDSEGMAVDGTGALKDILENWDSSKGKRPHVMYTVTMGQNPTGRLLSTERRRQIYALCQKYDIIIVEDDPYWFLQYPSAGPVKLASEKTSDSSDDGDALLLKEKKSSGYAFLDSLVPSYLSMDIDGRVVRLDTFSKTVAPGCRLGWITAQPAFIERMTRIAETNAAGPSGFVQSLICEMVIGPQNSSDPARGGLPDGRGWQFDGWVRWLEGLRGSYEHKMNILCQTLEDGKYLVKSGRRGSMADEFSQEWSVIERTQMYDFIWPRGGMFMWLEILIENHPLYQKSKKEGKSFDGTTLSHTLWLFLTTKPHLVLLAPASIFSATEQIKKEKSYRFFRLCYSASSDEELAAISKRTARGIESFWKIKDAKTIQKLLDDEKNTSADSSVDEVAAQMANLGVYMGSY